MHHTYILGDDKCVYLAVVVVWVVWLGPLQSAGLLGHLRFLFSLSPSANLPLAPTPFVFLRYFYNSRKKNPQKKTIKRYNTSCDYYYHPLITLPYLMYSPA